MSNLSQFFNSGSSKSVVLTGAGTWTVPSTVSAINVLLVGGGGGGGRAPQGNSFMTGAGGGGGGEIGMINGLSVTPGGSISYSVGAGGAGRTTSTGVGTDGGDTTFGSYTAYGGGGGYGGQAAGAGDVYYAPGGASPKASMTINNKLQLVGSAQSAAGDYACRGTTIYYAALYPGGKTGSAKSPYIAMAGAILTGAPIGTILPIPLMFGSQLYTTLPSCNGGGGGDSYSNNAGGSTYGNMMMENVVTSGGAAGNNGGGGAGGNCFGQGGAGTVAATNSAAGGNATGFGSGGGGSGAGTTTAGNGGDGYAGTIIITYVG